MPKISKASPVRKTSSSKKTKASKNVTAAKSSAKKLGQRAAKVTSTTKTASSKTRTKTSRSSSSKKSTKNIMSSIDTISRIIAIDIFASALSAKNFRLGYKEIRSIIDNYKDDLQARLSDDKATEVYTSNDNLTKKISNVKAKIVTKGRLAKAASVTDGSSKTRSSRRKTDKTAASDGSISSAVSVKSEISSASSKDATILAANDTGKSQIASA